MTKGRLPRAMKGRGKGSDKGVDEEDLSSTGLGLSLLLTGLRHRDNGHLPSAAAVGESHNCCWRGCERESPPPPHTSSSSSSSSSSSGLQEPPSHHVQLNSLADVVTRLVSEAKVRVMCMYLCVCALYLCLDVCSSCEPFSLPTSLSPLSTHCPSIPLTPYIIKSAFSFSLPVSYCTRCLLCTVFTAYNVYFIQCRSKTARRTC